MACGVRNRVSTVKPVTLLTVTLVALLVAKSVDGQSGVSNRTVVSSRSSRTKEASRPSSRPSSNTTLTRPPSKPRPASSGTVVANTIPPRTIVVSPSSINNVFAATVTGTRSRVTPGTPPKPRPRPAAVKANDEVDESEYEDEEDDAEELESQISVETSKPLSTRPPIASVVTPPLPVVPLQTIFTVTGGDPPTACIAVKAGIRFTFSYVNVSSGKIERGVVDLPARNYSIDGECGQTRQRMSLLFSPDKHISPTAAIEAGIAWNLTFSFVRNESDIFADQMSLRYVIATGQLPFPWSVDARMTAALKQPGLFRTPAEEHSFICMSDAGYGNFVIIADTTDGSNDGPVSLALPSDMPIVTPPAALGDGLTPQTNQTVQLNLIELYNLQLQAFLKPPPTGAESSQTPAVSFSSQVVQCSGDFISLRVPIVLGIVLLLFVVTVVIVYMVRRLMHGKHVDEKHAPIDYRPVH